MLQTARGFPGMYNYKNPTSISNPQGSADAGGGIWPSETIAARNAGPMLIFSEVNPARNSSPYAKELDEVVAQLGFSTNSLQLDFQLRLQVAGEREQREPHEQAIGSLPERS